MKTALPTDKFDEQQLLRITGQWGGGGSETRCGRGSRMENTGPIREILPVWVEKYNIRSLSDIGAGDMNWMKHVLKRTSFQSVEYRAYDLFPRSPEVQFLDVTSTQVPDCDAILCRHVLNHLPRVMVLEALELMKKAAKYLMLSTTPGGLSETKHGRYFGYFTGYDLELPDFNMGPPLELSEDHNTKLGLWEVR